MMKKLFPLLILCLTLGAFGAEENMAAGDDEAAQPKNGYALLDSLLSTFQGLSGEGSLGQAAGQLGQMYADAQAAREANLIDPVFYNRYRRLLLVLKIILTPVEEHEMWDIMFEKELDAFVADVICERWTWHDKTGISKLATALENEFVELKLYLDNGRVREELKKKFAGKMLPPPPSQDKHKEEKK